jgi:hypothetical protein
MKPQVQTPVPPEEKKDMKRLKVKQRKKIHHANTNHKKAEVVCLFVCLFETRYYHVA